MIYKADKANWLNGWAGVGKIWRYKSRQMIDSFTVKLVEKYQYQC